MPLPTKISEAIRLHPNTCPFCQSTNLDADSPKLGFNDELKVHVTCTQCLREWVEIYTVTSVISVEEDDDL